MRVRDLLDEDEQEGDSRSVLLLDVTTVPETHVASGVDLAALAAKSGLHKVGGRPALLTYIRQIWKRRHFCVEMARGWSIGENEGSRLGQLWALLTPLLWAALYLFIFGVVVKTTSGTENFAGFLVIGLFIFRFVAGCIADGGKSIKKNISLITSLQFPRALIPLAAVTAELFLLIPAIAVMVALALLTGEPLRWHVLLLVPAIALMFVFTMGVAMMSARAIADVPDLVNMLPFVTRALMYVSGIFFSIETFAGDGVLGKILGYQPLAIYIELARSALLVETQVRGTTWLWAIGWAISFFVAGFLYFWRAEARYGRG